jgi:hypothetical protein
MAAMSEKDRKVDECLAFHPFFNNQTGKTPLKHIFTISHHHDNLHCSLSLTNEISAVDGGPTGCPHLFTK